MKWFIIIIVLVLIVGVYLMIKRQSEYNKDATKQTQLLNTAAQFGPQNLVEIDEQKISPVDVFINNKWVTMTSGWFGKIWGSIYSG